MLQSTANFQAVEQATLVVDLDQTLIKTDVLLEQVLCLLKSQPLALFKLLSWTLRGRVFCKQRLAEAISIDVAHLPIREEVLALIAAEKKAGSRIVLASASHADIVNKIAREIGFFDEVIATQMVNLKGEKKLAAIRRLIGERPFTYVADSSADLTIWKRSTAAIAINPSRYTRLHLSRLNVPFKIIQDADFSVTIVAKSLRIHQWVKNVLLFLPILAGHHFLNIGKWRDSFIAAFAFSLLASSVYIMNDLFDLNSDRKHATKNQRPFASGRLSIKTGCILFLSLVTAAALIVTTADSGTKIYLFAYFFLNVLYSFRLKELMLVDTVILATFYTLRILAGGEAANVPISPWLLAFSIFFFWGLAMVKRYAELLQSRVTTQLIGRGYTPDDKLPIMAAGIASSFMAILVCAMYLNGPQAMALYSNPQRLWLIVPILLYWSSRVWLLAHRGKMHDDPVLFSIKDKVSWATFACAALVLILAI